MLLTSTECRAIAEEKLAAAGHDGGTAGAARRLRRLAFSRQSTEAP